MGEDGAAGRIGKNPNQQINILSQICSSVKYALILGSYTYILLIWIRSRYGVVHTVLYWMDRKQ